MKTSFEDQIFGAPSTVRVQKSLFRNWIAPEVLENTEVSQQEVKRLTQKWLGKGLTPGTVGSLVSLYSKYAKWCECPIDIGEVLKYLKRQTVREKKALTFDEAQKLLRYSKRTEHYMFVLMGLHCGLRIGEIYALKGHNFDLDKKLVHIDSSRDITSKVLGPTKTGERRSVPLTNSVLAEFQHHNKKGYLFPDNYRPYRWFPVLCDEAEVPKITPHGLRHTFCSLLLEGGESPKKVAELAGHSVQTTLTTYWWSLKSYTDLSVLPDTEEN